MGNCLNENTVDIAFVACLLVGFDRAAGFLGNLATWAKCGLGYGSVFVASGVREIFCRGETRAWLPHSTWRIGDHGEGT